MINNEMAGAIIPDHLYSYFNKILNVFHQNNIFISFLGLQHLLLALIGIVIATAIACSRFLAQVLLLRLAHCDWLCPFIATATVEGD